MKVFGINDFIRGLARAARDATGQTPVSADSAHRRF